MSIEHVNVPSALKDRAASATEAANLLQLAAQRAAAEAESKRVAAEKAQREARDREREFQRIEDAWSRDTAGQLAALEKEIRAELAKKPESTHIDPGLRSSARSWLYGPDVELFPLAVRDGRVARRLDLHRRAGQALMRLAPMRNSKFDAEADRLECLAWCAVIDAVRFLAGELTV